jgi:hypothetical protein
MKTLVIIAALFVATTAHAQVVNFGALDEGRNVATATTGADDGVVLGTGYARVLSVADRPIVLGGDLTLPMVVDADDFRLRAGALASIIGDGRWKLIGGFALTVRGTNNDIARMIDIGTDVAIVAGRYARRWFGAAELGFDWAMTTHVHHSDAYRMNVFADARDGWYGNAGGMIRAGVQGGISFGHHDVILRAGRSLDVAGNPAMLPIYGTLAFNTRW